jgi:hypothetical protein
MLSVWPSQSIRQLERLVPSPLLEKIDFVNATLFHLLEQTQRSLAGQGDFNVELVRRLSTVVSEMDLVLPRSTEVRLMHPELAAPLDHYSRLAGGLRTELDNVQMMLLARRSSLEAACSHLQAASQFVAALSSTR